MIETKIIHENPTIVYHRVLGRMSEDEAIAGIEKAKSTIENVVSKTLNFDMIVDMRGYILENLDAHRIWSTGLKEKTAFKLDEDDIVRVAIIGDDTPTFKVERDMMESNILKFFTELEIANKWLKSA